MKIMYMQIPLAFSIALLPMIDSGRTKVCILFPTVAEFAIYVVVERYSDDSTLH